MIEEVAELTSTVRNQEKNLNLAGEIGLALNTQNAELQLKIKQLEGDLDNKETKIADLNHELSKKKGFKIKETELNSAITKLEEERSKNGDKIEKLKARIRKLEIENQRKEKNIKINDENSKENEEQLTKEVASLKKLLSQVQEQKSRSEENNAELIDEIKKLEDEK